MKFVLLCILLSGCKDNRVPSLEQRVKRLEERLVTEIVQHMSMCHSIWDTLVMNETMKLAPDGKITQTFFVDWRLAAICKE